MSYLIMVEIKIQRYFEVKMWLLFQVEKPTLISYKNMARLKNQPDINSIP